MWSNFKKQSLDIGTKTTTKYAEQDKSILLGIKLLLLAIAIAIITLTGASVYALVS